MRRSQLDMRRSQLGMRRSQLIWCRYAPISARYASIPAHWVSICVDLRASPAATHPQLLLLLLLVMRLLEVLLPVIGSFRFIWICARICARQFKERSPCNAMQLSRGANRACAFEGDMRQAMRRFACNGFGHILTDYKMICAKICAAIRPESFWLIDMRQDMRRYACR